MAAKKTNPMLTKTGKQRLGPLGVKQLQELLEKTSSRPKERAKVERALEQRLKQFPQKATPTDVTETTTAE